MEHLEKIILPPNVNFISEYTFDGDSKVVVYAPEESETITNVEQQGIPTNTVDYDTEYSKYLEAYIALGY